MQYLQLTLRSPAENIALDEALLDAAESGEINAPILRLWEPSDYCVVLGRSSEATTEVHLQECRRQQIPVLRRPSGGGTVLAGPGSLMYAVVLSLESLPQLRAVDQAHHFVLNKMAEILAPLVPDAAKAGISDLVTPSPETGALRKFSGNSLRYKRHHLLYHGTLLYDFDLEQIARFLSTQTREPEYRNGRSHTEFVTNITATKEQLTTAILAGWQANEPRQQWPQQRVDDLVRARYQTTGNWLIQAAYNA